MGRLLNSWRGRFDDRSKRFAVRELVGKESAPRSRKWSCPVRLNQGTSYACTGFAMVHALASAPRRIPDPSKSLAFKLYQAAKLKDRWEGENYDGTSVLAVAKVAKELGFFDEYRWGFSLGDLVKAVLEVGPVVVGMKWDRGFQNPDRWGQAHVSGVDNGRHAVAAIGVDLDREQIVFVNSFGWHWGKAGCFRVSFEDMEIVIRSGVEMCVPVVKPAAR